MNTKKMNIGFIGLGVMGSRAAKKILDVGFSIFGYDINANARRNAQQNGIKVVNKLENLTGVKVLFLSLPGPPEVEAVIIGSKGIATHLRSGTIVLDLSSVDPSTSKKMAGYLAPCEVAYLDAPVLGRPNSVGEWILPVGGAKKALDQCQEILKAIAKQAIHVGESGTGSAIKLLNNLMVGGLNAVIAEVMALSNSVGLSPRVLFEIISASKAPTNNLLFQVKGKRILEQDFSPAFKLELLAKDNDLCIKMANQLGIPLIIGGAVNTVNKLAQLKGMGDKDTAVLYKLYTELFEQK